MDKTDIKKFIAKVSKVNRTDIKKFIEMVNTKLGRNKPKVDPREAVKVVAYLGLGTFSVGVLLSAGSYLAAPKNVQVYDLNKDGIEDVVTEKGDGLKKVYFGQKQGEKTVYLSASELTDEYQRLEDQLNKEKRKHGLRRR